MTTKTYDSGIVRRRPWMRLICLVKGHRWKRLRINKFQWQRSSPANTTMGIDQVCLRCGQEQIYCDTRWGYKSRFGTTHSNILHNTEV